MPRRLLGYGVSLAVTIGMALIGHAVGSTLAGSPSASRAYTEKTVCADCPSGTDLRSVEVQDRQGSVLFVVRGQLPASADSLPNSIRLLANEVDIVLKPHGAQGTFEVERAARAGSALAPDSFGASLQQGALLLDISSQALQKPVRFEAGFWDGQGYRGRLPRNGQLEWNGTAIPRLAATPTAVTPVPTTTASGLDLTQLTNACIAIPSGSLPPYLQITGLSGGPQADPRTQVMSRQVTATTVQSPNGVNARFAFGAVIFRSGERLPSASGRLIDQAGTLQLWFYNDGQAKHKGIRTFAGGRWSTELEPDSLTFRLFGQGASLYWTGLKAGDKFGFVTAAESGCGSAGLDSRLMPLQTLP